MAPTADDRGTRIPYVRFRRRPMALRRPADNSPGTSAHITLTSDHEHSHRHGAEAVSDRGLLWAMALNIGLSVCEVVAGVIAGKVATGKPTAMVPESLRVRVT